MKKQGILALTGLLALLLAACGGDGGSGGGEVRITCAEVANEGAGGYCPALAGMSTQTIEIVLGDVSRGILINGTTQASNPLDFDVDVQIGMIFDAGCAGADTWEIMPVQPYTVAAGDAFEITVGGQCSDMPLGPRTLTASLYEADGATLIGDAVVYFTLVE